MSKPLGIIDMWDQLLRQSGFKKKGSSWFRETHQLVEILTLEKSRFGSEYYGHIGYWLKTLGPYTGQKAWDCHVDTRFEEVLTPKTIRMIRDVMDPEQRIEYETRRTLTSELIVTILEPYLRDTETIDGLKKAVEMTHLGVDPEVRRILEAT